MISNLAMQVLRQGLDDWVPLAAVTGMVRKFGISSNQAIREATAAIVKELTSEGFAVLGEVTPGGFVPSREPASAIIERIASPQAPERGEAWDLNAWLSNTEKGDAAARSSQ
jgi:hypothetical protein